MAAGAGGVTGRVPAERTSASDRVARLLAMVPWIAAQDGPTIDEICARFALTRRKLADDLEALQYVGLPPYTPDTLIEVTQEGDRVWLRFADVFSRPLHLTPEQGVALVAAGAASQGLPGGEREGPLSSALAKLAGVLGVDPGEALSVDLGDSRPGVLEALQGAVTDRRRARLDYYSYGRDERSTRDVDPYAVGAQDGAWYLHAYCHEARARRSFRVDRIVEVDILDETFEPPPADRGGSPHLLASGIPRVTLDLGPTARWVVETYPVDEVVERDGGWLRVRMPVTATPWLERLLIRLGSDARVVVADDPGHVDAGRDAARRVLARYGDG
jgi:proteasome accessory factor C